MAGVIQALPLPRGWADQHLELVAMTFRRPADASPDAWVADEP